MADALKTVFGLGAGAVGLVLKNLGVAAQELAQIVGDLFDLGAEALESLLGAIGFAADVISDALDFLGDICFFC